MAIYQKPKTCQAHPGRKIYPYLLRGLAESYGPDEVENRAEAIYAHVFQATGLKSRRRDCPPIPTIAAALARAFPES